MGETPNSWRGFRQRGASPRVGASLSQCEKTVLAWLYETLPTSVVYQKSKGLKPYFVPLRAFARKWRETVLVSQGR
jgi:hypothetical protein